MYERDQIEDCREKGAWLNWFRSAVDSLFEIQYSRIQAGFAIGGVYQAV